MHVRAMSSIYCPASGYVLWDESGKEFAKCENPLEDMIHYDEENGELITSPHCRADAVAYFRDLGYDV